MDFARKQLEKYGWSDGKGLGKNENGISEALKPKLKRSVTGIGHDPASEFNEHWWTALYDKAAKNVEVEDKDGKTKKIKTNSNDLVISSSTWKINKKPKNTDDAEYSEYFVRTAVLTNDKGGKKTENVRSDSESDDDDDEKKDVLKMTDEELFAACGGRTAHKGARHGLRATGKLARIAEQEQKLLIQPQYEGYTHAKKLREQNKTCGKIKEKKVKSTNCAENDSTQEHIETKDLDKTSEEDNKSKDTIEVDSLEDFIGLQNKDKSKKNKRNKNIEDTVDKAANNISKEMTTEHSETVVDSTNNAREKKKNKRNNDKTSMDDEISENNESIEDLTIKSKKRCKTDDNVDTLNEGLKTVKVISKKKKNKKYT